MDVSFLDWFRRPPVSERLRAAHVREDLAQAADEAAFGRPCDGEINALATLLKDDEIVQQLVEGRRRKVPGLLALTTRRILFTTEGTDPQNALAIDRADVLAAAGQVHRGLGTLTLTTRSEELVVDQILGNQAETFAEKTMRAPEENRSIADPLVELRELRARHLAGDISDADFEARKKQLFEQI